MASSSSGSSTERGLEDNMLAILDSSAIKEARDLHDDRITFLEAVRSLALDPDRPLPLSRRIYGAVFHILKNSNSLEVALSSFQILTELSERYPRVHAANSGKQGDELVVVKEAWAPFVVGSEISCGGGNGVNIESDDLFDSSKFSLLVEDIAQSVNASDVQLAIKNMLLFQYLVGVIEKDFITRKIIFKETLDWTMLRETIVNIVLGSRKVNFKGLVKDCISIMCRRCGHTKECIVNINCANDSSTNIYYNGNVASSIAINEVESGTFIALEKLLKLITEFDALRKQADQHGLTSRADCFRNSLLDIVLDELTYNKDNISSFLEAVHEPNLKLEIVVCYFSKYFSKPSTRTHKAMTRSDVTTFENILCSFSTIERTKNTVKKLSSEVAQLLLAHGFQAYMPLLHVKKVDAGAVGRTESKSFHSICSGLISAFDNIKKVNRCMEIPSFEKEALFTAATILSNTT